MGHALLYSGIEQHCSSVYGAKPLMRLFTFARVTPLECCVDFCIVIQHCYPNLFLVLPINTRINGQCGIAYAYAASRPRVARYCILKPGLKTQERNRSLHIDQGLYIIFQMDWKRYIITFAKFLPSSLRPEMYPEMSDSTATILY